jgi:hypothetical protein
MARRNICKKIRTNNNIHVNNSRNMQTLDDKTPPTIHNKII